LFDVNTVKEGRILAENLQLERWACMKSKSRVTHDSFNEIARAANEDIGQASHSVERSKELISGLR